MPNIKSSKKSVRQIADRAKRNHELKARVHNSIRNCDYAINAKEKDKANKQLKDVQKYADKACSKGLIKPNKVNREKKRLNKKIKEME